MTEVLAVDIGGTKLAAARVDPAGGLHGRRQVATPTGDGEVVWAALTGLIDDVTDGRPLAGIGVGTAGPLDGGRVSPVNITGWRGFPLLDRLRDRHPDLPVRLAGDAICAVLGEHWLGAGRGRADLLGVVVSTGVGGGLILGDRPHTGPTGNAGHIGHVIVDLDGPPCPCGSVGCVETVASGPSMVAWALAQGWRAPAAATGRELVGAAGAGDPVAVAAFDRGARALAAGLIAAVALCDVDCAVIGGGVAAAGEVLFNPLRSWLHRLAGLDFIARLDIVASTLPGTAGLLGAAALVR